MSIPGFSAVPKRLNAIFEDGVEYVIPEFQRPYSWNIRGKGEQVVQLWSDLLSSFERRGEKSNYFLGSIVVISEDQLHFDVVDGQQRLTTFCLFFAAMKHFLLDIQDKQKEYEEIIRDGAVPILEKLLFNQTIKGFKRTKSAKLFRRENSTELDSNLYFRRALDGLAFEDILLHPKNKEQIERYFHTADYFRSRLRAYFLKNDRLSHDNLEKLQDFLEFIKNNIFVVQITTTSLEMAYFIFETLNHRGLPLQTKDLFRNFLIKEFILADFQDANARLNRLEMKYNVDDSFLNCFLESKSIQITGNSFPYRSLILCYNSKDYEDEYAGRKKIEVFYQDLERNLKLHDLLEREDFPSAFVNHRVKNTKILAKAKVYPVLLALFRYQEDYNLEDKELVSFLCAFEQYLLYYLLKPSVHFPKDDLIAVVNLLNTSGGFQIAQDRLTLSPSMKDELREAISGDIFDHEMAKVLIVRYIWFLTLKNYESKGKEDLIEQKLLLELATLEHILPQRPASQSNWLKFPQSFREAYTFRLGNMTLLTKGDNSSARNSDWERKRQVYERTQLSLTSRLTHATPTIPFFQKRHEEIVGTLFADLDLGAYNAPPESFELPPIPPLVYAPSNPAPRSPSPAPGVPLSSTRPASLNPSSLSASSSVSKSPFPSAPLPTPPHSAAPSSGWNASPLSASLSPSVSSAFSTVPPVSPAPFVSSSSALSNKAFLLEEGEDLEAPVSPPPPEETESLTPLCDFEWDTPTGKKPASLVFKKKTIAVKSWRDVWVSGLYYLHEAYPLKYPLLFEDERLSSYLQAGQWNLGSSKPVPSPKEKGKSWYAETQRSASWLVSFLKIALDICGIRLEDVSILYKTKA